MVDSCGTGKSHLAQAICHAALKQDYDVLFASVAQLHSSLYQVQVSETFDRRF